MTVSASARTGRSFPAGVIRSMSSSGTLSPAASDTPRTTSVGQPAAAACARMTADSMSTATAPLLAKSAALAAAVATTSREVTRVPPRAAPARSVACRWGVGVTLSRSPLGPSTLSGSTRSPALRSGARPPQTPPETTSG